VPVESLAQLSTVDLEVDCLAHDLELGIGDTLGISLSEVCSQYFQDSDEGHNSKVGRDLVEEQNYGDVITNHVWSGQYQTKDIDGVPYTMYREDTLF
jgi:hypothetical protein